MNPRIIIALALAALVMAPAAEARSSCPANDPNLGPYNKVEILNDQHQAAGYKLVDKPFYVKAVKVNPADKTEKPIVGTTVTIYFCNNGLCSGSNKQRLVSGSTDSKGEYKYTPTKLGKYMVECAGKAPMIDLRMILDQPSQFGAVCGDGKCEADKYETRANCPDDCTVCGDAVCEGNEDKDSCPDDCLICGDGVCDPEEYTEQGCSCIEDCIVCGDGRCDSMYASETPEKCPQDCGSGPKPVPKTDFLRDYWWAIAAGAAVLVFLFLKREGLHMYFGRGGEKPAKEDKPKKVPDKRPAKGWVRDDTRKKAAEDEDVMGIVSELMESGVSDKNIRKKMVEFGLDEDEAERIIEKARKE